jgi:hypothetical protein
MTPIIDIFKSYYAIQTYTILFCVPFDIQTIQVTCYFYHFKPPLFVVLYIFYLNCDFKTSFDIRFFQITLFNTDKVS